MDYEISLFITKLILGGIVSFLAILLMSKTRDFASMTLIFGILSGYAVIVYKLLIKLGVLTVSKIQVFGVPLSIFLCILIPSVFLLIYSVGFSIGIGFFILMTKSTISISTIPTGRAIHAVFTKPATI